MKTHRRQKFEIVFYAILTGFVGVSLGYYWAALLAAERVKEALK